MNFQFPCPHCRHTLEMDDARSGQETACPFCSTRITIPEPSPRLANVEKLKLKTHVEKQSYENISASDKTCPKCKFSCDVRAVICVSCGYNFVAASSVTASRRKTGRGFVGGFFGAIGTLVARLSVLAALVIGGFIGFVWFQNARLSQSITGALEKGELAAAKEDYRTLASYYRWFEYAHWPNLYKLRYRQFEVRERKTFPQTKNPVYPFLVVKSVWGNKQEINMKVGWVKFCLINVDSQPLEVSRTMFLLMGLDNNVALAHMAVKEDPKAVTLLRNEGMVASLYCAGIVKPPAFLEFNNGSLVLRAPTYMNFAMDNYDRDHRDWSQGRGADEFQVLKPWDGCKLSPEETAKYAKVYQQLKPPPDEPYTTVMKEANPR
ncbi:MAG: hypothetical protein EXS18_03340 [Verrucomicrobiae bacterium]|nr:hypothetical protein [Verrucomicrobiae bacterium]